MDPEAAGEQSQNPPQTAETEKPLTRDGLASLRSLIVNPSSPDSLISSIVETLTRNLHSSTDHLLLHHTIKLLTDLCLHRRHFSDLVFNLVRSFALSSESTRLAVESLDSSASISKHEKPFEDSFFVSLCFSASLSTRLWLLRNAERFQIRPHLLFTIFLGFTKDPYPCMRKAALDGLVSLRKFAAIEERSLIKGCFYRAVELLADSEASVRASAVRTVSEWGQILVASYQGDEKREWSNLVFIQLSSMARDMSMEVKVEAFQALGKTETVSRDTLLQTLSKKVLPVKENGSSSQGSIGQSKVSVSSAAGAILHGLEDEYHEVRNATCYAMQRLTILSSKFAGGAISLLMDMLNDDSVAVRLQVLETMYQMANSGHLFLQPTHMPMFLGSLIDNSSLIRNAVRKVLKVVKLQKLDLFRSSINGIIQNLEKNQEDEDEIFSVLFHMGRRHGKFVACVIKEVSQEMEPASDGKLHFDCARVAALLVLAISAPLNREHNCDIPPVVFSYAVTILGRISRALVDEADQTTLLAYLSHRSQCPGDSSSVFKREVVLPTLKDSENDESSLMQKDFEASEMLTEEKELTSLNKEYQQKINDQLLKCINAILGKVRDTWPLIKLGLRNEALRILRVCEEQLTTFAAEPASSLAFARLYLHIIKLLAQIWVHFRPTRNFSYGELGDLQFLLGNLERKLRDMRYKFRGFSEEVNLHISQLLLVSFILKLSNLDICCHQATLSKLSAMLSNIQLPQEGSLQPSSFVTELKKLLGSDGKICCHPFHFRKILDHVSFTAFELSGSMQYLSAELDVPGNDSENPIYFVRGLPVAIPVEITLKNMERESRLWLKMVVGEKLVQFIFLDPKLFGEWNEVIKFTQAAPFYRTPKATFFTVEVSIGMECLFGSSSGAGARRGGGPKYELTYLSPEKEVHLSSTRDLTRMIL